MSDAWANTPAVRSAPARPDRLPLLTSAHSRLNSRLNIIIIEKNWVRPAALSGLRVPVVVRAEVSVSEGEVRGRGWRQARAVEGHALWHLLEYTREAREGVHSR